MTTKLRAASFQDGAVTTAKIAADAVTNPKIADDAVQDENFASSVNLGRRNLIINGNFQCWQRSTSETGLGASAGYFTADRWRISTGNSAGRFTMNRTAGDPDGFNYGLVINCTTADTSIAANETMLIQQKIEGQDLQHLKKGTSGAETVTISFYAKIVGSATDFVVTLYDNDNNRFISKLFTFTTSWVRYYFTVPGDTTGTLDQDTSSSLELWIWLHAGSNHTSGTLQTSWGSDTNANRAVGIDSIYSSTDNEFYLAGVQMELGSEATPFEHRSFGEELQLCKRYFQVLADGSRSQNEAICAGTYYTASILFHSVVLPVEMRAQPTMVTTNGTNYYITFANGGGDHHDAIARSGNSSKSVVEITAETNVSGTSGHACFTRIGGTSSDAKCMFDAEL